MSMMVNPSRFAAAGVTDPSISSVVLLCGFEGADGSTSVADESPIGHTLTAVGNAQIDTAQSRFGTSSLLLDTTGDYVSAPDHASHTFGTGQFTVETWVRFASTPSRCYFFSTYDNSSTGWMFYLNTGNLRFFFNGSGARSTLAAWAPTSGVWYHIAADRDASGNVRVYVDGAMIAKANFPQSFDDNTRELHVGGWSILSNFGLNGWMDEVRITKGLARYASDSGYTVPAAAFPRS